jgi:hypothetical protein
MDFKWFRSGIGVGMLVAGLAAGVLAHPAAAAGPPTAFDDSQYVAAGITNDTSGMFSVLANDAGSGNGTLTAAVVQTTSNGTLNLRADGTFEYTPNGGYSGLDTFTYQATDGGGTSNTANVSLTIDNLPVANSDQYSTQQDVPLTVTGANSVLANDTDAENDLLTAALNISSTHGQLLFSPDGTFTYTPDLGFQGVDSFEYCMYDGKAAFWFCAVVTITVDPPANAAPIGAFDYYDTYIDTPLSDTAPGVLSNDTDADNDPLVVANVSGPSHGTGGIQPDGTLTYTPDPGFTGDDFIYYTPFDGTNYGNQVSAWISVAANHVPVAADDHYTATHGQDLIIDIPGVLANDTDADSDALVAFSVYNTSSFYGDWTLNSDGSFTYHQFVGSNYVGDDTFYYAVFDGTKNSKVVAVTITILPEDAPTPTPTDTPDDKTPPPPVTPGDETPTPSPTDTADDETPTPPSGSQGGETSTPVATETPSDPASKTPDGTKAPETEIGGVTSLPDTGTGTPHESGSSMLTAVLAIVGLSGLFLAARSAKRRTAR